MAARAEAMGVAAAAEAMAVEKIWVETAEAVREAVTVATKVVLRAVETELARVAVMVAARVAVMEGARAAEMAAVVHQWASNRGG